MGLWDDAEFAIMGSAGAAPASGSGFMLDRDEAEDLVKRLRDLRNQLRDMRQDVASLCRITPPSKDPGTLIYQHALTTDPTGKFGALDYGGGHVDLQIAYVTELIDRIDKALGHLQTSDQEQAGNVNTTGEQPQGKI